MNKPDPFLVDEENPEWTEADFAKARPAREVMGDALLTALEQARLARLRDADTAVHISPQVVDFYRGQGENWRERLIADLEALVREKRRA